MSTVCEVQWNKTIHSSSYHHASNGQQERPIPILKSKLTGMKDVLGYLLYKLSRLLLSYRSLFIQQRESHKQNCS